MDEIIKVDKETGEISIPEQIVNAIRDNEVQIKEAKKQNEDFKEKLLKAMEEYGVEKIESEFFTVSYVAESERTSTDTQKLKDEYQDVYWKTLKVSPVKASVRVRLKNV